jgi:hypothetical protein
MSLANLTSAASKTRITAAGRTFSIGGAVESRHGGDAGGRKQLVPPYGAAHRNVPLRRRGRANERLPPPLSRGPFWLRDDGAVRTLPLSCACAGRSPITGASVRARAATAQTVHNFLLTCRCRRGRHRELEATSIDQVSSA